MKKLSLVVLLGLVLAVFTGCSPSDNTTTAPATNAAPATTNK